MLRVLDLRGSAAEVRPELPRPAITGEEPVGEVRQILDGVRSRGDAAVREYTLRFDGVDVPEPRVPAERLLQALEATPAPIRTALVEAHAAIEAFHRHRPPAPAPFRRDGVVVHDIARAVRRAGLYVPGGRASYPSTVLMTAVPARVAGVREIALCVPPAPDGEIAPVTLAAAAVAGVDEVYRIGGAQAIAALAFGTETIARVDVIAGPGNRYVSIAEREVAGVVGVPRSFAGPSEVVVVADDTTPAELAAVDLVVQAEHGPDGLAWLITWSTAAAELVAGEVGRITAASPRRREIESTLSAGGYVVLVDGPEQAMAVANEIAPEHLELCNEDPWSLVPLVESAGAVFVGCGAPASVGDYLAGPSHVLPTFGSARYASALGVEDFVKRIHAIEVEPDGMDRVAPLVATLAEAEGLPAHAESVRLRAGGMVGRR